MFLIQREVPSDPSSIAYFMGCASQAKSIAIDVHKEDVEWFIEQAAQKGVNIDYVIDTHIHADHLSGAMELVKRTGASYMLHESASPKFSFTPLYSVNYFVRSSVNYLGRLIPNFIARYSWPFCVGSFHLHSE